jgi:hypothetical protein
MPFGALLIAFAAVYASVTTIQIDFADVAYC